MIPGGWATAWAELRAQWQVNSRLRLGVWAIVGIVWIYALLLGSDGVVAVRTRAQALTSEIDRLQPLMRANPWPARVDDARQHLDALRTMEWAEGEGGDLGLTEAALQDWVRATAGKAGLRLREMTLSRAAVPAAAGAVSTTLAAELPGQAVKLRITADWGRVELVAFLAEVGRSPSVVVVERLLLRPAATPAGVEIDLRVWVRRGVAAGAPAPGAATGPSR